MLEDILIFGLIGIITGFFDSVIGAGGLISIPLLVFFGLSPQSAIATDRLGIIGQTLSALYTYNKEKKIIWKYIPLFTILAGIGAIIGATILLKTTPQLIKTILAILLILLLPLILFNKNLGIKASNPNSKLKTFGTILYFFVMIFSGFFGVGSGPMLVYILTYFFGFTFIQTIATNIISWFVISVITTIIFAYHNLIDYKIGIILFIGMSIGSYLGAKFAIKKGEKTIKLIFIIFVLAFSLKLLFF